MKETKTFQTEINQLLDLMINSLYSHKEIFLRELISNASDAIDKLKYASLTNTSLIKEGYDPEIRIANDKKQNTITVKDNGIGMDYQEVIDNIGTIAQSGTKKFLEISRELKDRPELIGQFGVGFYSSFMVAEKVILHTQKAGESEGVLWESNGDGTYSIDKVPRAEGHGTSVTIKLKPKESDKEEENYQDFTDEWTIKSTIRKYSDFISHPVKMKIEKEIPKKDEKGEIIKDKYEKVIEDEILNSQKALWLKPQNEIKEEEYNEFYKHISHDWNKPLKVIHFKAEGTFEYTAMLFIPEKRPWDFYTKGNKFGLNLYVRRVFIMNNCEDILPNYLRFMKGLVDSSDLSLNVSRELLQQDRQVKHIQKSLTSKILNTFSDLLAKEREEYEKFWENFGPTLKEGIASDFANKEKLQKLFLFHSTHSDKLSTLDEYINRMKKEQKNIYYVTGDNLHQIKNSPYLEKLKDKGYEVLLMVDPVDEWVVENILEYQKKELQSITKENLDLESKEEKKEQEENLKKQTEKFSSIIQLIKDHLKDYIKDVKISSRLTESPVCLVSGQHDPSARMERLMKEFQNMGLSEGNSLQTKRILEINPNHQIFTKIQGLPVDEQKKWIDILYSQALLNEGGEVPDPVKFSKQVSELMIKASDALTNKNSGNVSKSTT